MPPVRRFAGPGDRAIACRRVLWSKWFARIGVFAVESEDAAHAKSCVPTDFATAVRDIL